MTRIPGETLLERYHEHDVTEEQIAAVINEVHGVVQMPEAMDALAASGICGSCHVPPK